jgi:S-DNA-T family DNA segregation ATPase FtsK/SpoIIIE
VNTELLKYIGDYERYTPEIQVQIISLMQKMISLGFLAKFQRVEEGPIIRTYYFEPSPSAPLARIIGKEEDLALTLHVESIIISRELGSVTVEVPKTERQLIRFDKSLHTLMTSGVSETMTLPILMGQDTRGKEFYVDLATQPHLLIAGSTNSGKSIFTSQLICSLALFHSASELKFHLVDTKQLDLTLFAGLPHIGKVITDIHSLRKQLGELLDTVRERTAMMSGLYRNIAEWNRVESSKMPYHICIIDEFADVLDSDREYMAGLHKDVKKEMQPIDVLVKRLAQISRAAGVHLVIATQRPSVKVVSGDIKTNFPARICFKLPSMQDSRVILDENGAERLLGKGDYLYKTSTSETIKRAHSAFVSANDIAMIIAQSDMIREQYLSKKEEV